MTYQEFLNRVQSQAGLGSHEETARAVTATLGTLREYLEGGAAGELPQELQQLLPAGLSGAGGQPGGVAGGAESSNPQLAGETRVESGGESTAESGQ